MGVSRLWAPTAPWKTVVTNSSATDCDTSAAEGTLSCQSLSVYARARHKGVMLPSPTVSSDCETACKQEDRLPVGIKLGAQMLACKESCYALVPSHTHVCSFTCRLILG